MFCRSIILAFALLLLTINLAAHEADSSAEKKGKPIVQVFTSMYYNPTGEKKLGFGIGRAHLGYQYKFDDHFLAKIVLDRGRPTTVGSLLVTDSVGNQYQLFGTISNGSYYSMTLKFAFLQWKMNDHLKIQAGSILQDHYITQERFWGYRYVAETFIDRYYHIPSGDLGIIAYYQFNKKFGIDFAVTNGEGFRFDQDALGKVKIAAGVNLNFIKNLQLRVYYQNKASSDSINIANEQLFAFFAGYKYRELFRIGFEFNYMLSYLNVKNFNSGGISVYGSVRVWKKWNAYARYDLVKYDKSDEGNRQTLVFNGGNAVITGIQYSPISKINLSLNYQGWLTPEQSNINLLLLSLEFKI